MPAYIKKDKDHDVLDNPIKLDFSYEIPKEVLPIVEIKGRKYFWNKDKIEIQCAKCLSIMRIHAKPDPEKKQEVRTIGLVYPDECYCYKVEEI